MKKKTNFYVQKVAKKEPKSVQKGLFQHIFWQIQLFTIESSTKKQQPHCWNHVIKELKRWLGLIPIPPRYEFSHSGLWPLETDFGWRLLISSSFFFEGKKIWTEKKYFFFWCNRAYYFDTEMVKIVALGLDHEI